MKLLHALSGILLAVAFACLPPHVAAADSGLADAIRPAFLDAGVTVMRDGISLDEAVSRAEAQYRARVVRADIDDVDGRVIYVLRLLSDDGRVFTVRIDAASGGQL